MRGPGFDPARLRAGLARPAARPDRRPALPAVRHAVAGAVPRHRHAARHRRDRPRLRRTPLLTEQLGLAALVFILAEGGLTTRWEQRPSGARSRHRAVHGVRGGVDRGGRRRRCTCCSGFDWRTSLLWGAVLSSTDAAAVFSVLRGVGVKPRLAAALELESGLNDAPVVHRRHAAGQHRSDHLGRPRCSWSTSWWPGRIDRRRDRLRRGVAAAPRGAARGGAVPAGHHRADRRRVRGRVRSRTRPDSWPSTSPRSSSATRGCRTARPPCRSRRGSAGSRRSGCSSCWACTSTRRDLPEALLSGIVIGLIRAAGRPAAVGGRRRAAVPSALARAGVPVLVRAARGGADRAGDDPAGVPGCDSAAAAAQRDRGRRGDLHAAAGQHAAVGRPQARASSSSARRRRCRSRPRRWRR